MKILSSTYLEVHQPAQFPERSNEGPLSINTVKFLLKKNKLKSREKRATPDYFSISVKFGPMSMRIECFFLNNKTSFRTDWSHACVPYLDSATLSMK